MYTYWSRLTAFVQLSTVVTILIMSSVKLANDGIADSVA